MDDTDTAAISFGTDGWRATLDVFTEERVRMVGQAVGTHLRERGQEAPVAVGYDARPTSRGFAEELARVLAANGFDVLLPERDVPTPVVAWTVTDRNLSGALMVTASHNPPEYNGVKFIPEAGAPALPETTAAIEDALADPDPLPESEWGSVSETAFVEQYVENALWRITADIDGKTVVYDAMHGSGRGVTDRLLEEAGADVERLRCERDPEFGGTGPEPSAENLDELVARVTDGEAALGVANDGDADRLTLVTPGRGALDPNLFFAATYDHLLESESGDVVRTVSTSSIVDRVADDYDQVVHETPVGFKWVADAMAETDVVMGGEESGGFGVASHLRNKDGVYLALLAAGADATRSYDDRIESLLDQHGGIVQDRASVDCPDEHKEAVIEELSATLPEVVAGVEVEDVNDVDGFKIALADGTWLLVRPSGTEPKMRVYAEAGSQERVDDLLAAGEGLVEPLVD
jgi:phosphomannomutase